MLKEYFGNLMDAQILPLFFLHAPFIIVPMGAATIRRNCLEYIGVAKPITGNVVYPISMKSRKRRIGKIPERHAQLPPRPQGAYATRQPSLVLYALRVFQCSSDRQVHRTVEFRLHEHRKGFPAYASRSLASTHGCRR